MILLEILKAFIFGIVEGITEWLPISGTGHLILLEDFIKFNFSDKFVIAFFDIVRFGAVLAVIVLFFNELNPFSMNKNKQDKRNIINLWLKITIATMPVIIIRFVFNNQIDKFLYNSVIVSFMLILYGIIFVIEESSRSPKMSNLSSVSYKVALGIGLFQVLALVPGTSRAGATIIGALMLGTSRLIASEFSFFLAIPVMLEISLFKLFNLSFNLSNLEIIVIIVGSLTAFIVSLYSIQFLLDYIKKHDFKAFGYYRIILGIIILTVTVLDLFI
jgi:undecaprenyl-diphosphatase